MTTMTLMANTTVVGDAPTDNITPVQVPNAPSRATFTFNIAGPLSEYAGCTVLASKDGMVYLPFLTMALEAGAPNTINMEARINDRYTWWDAQLNYITPGGNNANLTMTY